MILINEYNLLTFSQGGNVYTKIEIENQFETWKEITEIYDKNQELISEIRSYIENPNVLVVFTGAGTSGYIGDYLETNLNAKKESNKFSSVYSTNIVGNPTLYLENKKIVLVSFARSGNSPESVEAVKLANQYSNSVKHLIITCNREGELAKSYPEATIQLPDITNDRGFAMTNSFSTMMLMAAKVFNLEFDELDIVNKANQLYEQFDYKKVTNYEFDNIVLLADGRYSGLLNELKLKFMELTNGRLGYYSDQFLNFRHGPKSVITKKSLIIMLRGGDEVAQKYQDDLLNELVNDENKPYIITFGTEGAETEIISNYTVDSYDFELGMIIVPTLQRCAVELSLKMGFNPDNPSPSGSVNRVVQGVTIHERGDEDED